MVINYCYKSDNERKFLNNYDERYLRMQKNILLNLADKKLTNKDIPFVITSLRCDNQINQLDLSNNLIGDEGIKQLVSSSAINNIFYFNLYNNQIGDEGAVAVVVSSRGNNIASLNIAKNRITVNGIIALSDQLPGSKIVNLDIIFNPGSDDPRGFYAILAAAKRHRLLQYLHVPSEFNRILKPVLLENREYVSVIKQELVNLITSLRNEDSFIYPMQCLDLSNLAKFQVFFYNQMLNNCIIELNEGATCRKIENYITDNYFKITRVVYNCVESDDDSELSLANLPLEALGRITKYCYVTDVDLKSNKLMS